MDSSLPKNQKGKTNSHDCRFPKCPECGSQRVWKDGLRKNSDRIIQLYLCRICGYRFSESTVKSNIIPQISKLSHPNSDLTKQMICNGEISFKKGIDGISFLGSKDVGSQTNKPQDITTSVKDLNSFLHYNSDCQISVTQTKGTKNLVKVDSQQKVAQREGTKNNAETKGKLFEFSWWMNKQGYSEGTNKTYIACLKRLLQKGASIYDSDSIKESIAKQKWSPNRKRIAINSYTLFLKMQGLTWEKPRCKITRKIPFIPTKKEIDTLIAGCGKKTATFLQLLKETAMRSGEAKRIKWTDIDSERRIIVLNEPEKGSNPRTWKVSSELIGMLNNLPNKNSKVFGEGSISSQKTTFSRARKRLAHKLKNPRLQRISFHTFRHWKATTLYHQTKDPYYVKQFLGHKSLKSTEIYITIERSIFDPTNDEYTVKITDKPEEIKNYLETGFEYVCNKEDLVFLRKRK